jgi:hypothetical protein
MLSKNSLASVALVAAIATATYLCLVLIGCVQPDGSQLMPECVNVFHPLVAAFVASIAIAILSVAFIIND